MDGIEVRDREIESLTEEVARLRARLDAEAAAPAPPAVPRRTGRGRAFLAVLLITLGALLAPIAVIAAWTKAEVTDTDRFVSTVAPLIDDPAFQAFLVDEVVQAVDDNVDIAAVTSDLFDGIATLDLPPRAQEALALLEQPAVQGARSLIQSATERLVTSDGFARVWDETLRVSHSQLTTALSGDTSGAVVISETGELGIQLGPIIDEVKTQLTAQGFALADRIPEVDRTIVVAQSDQLAQARTAYQLLDVLGFVLPWVSLLLLAAGVLSARKRSRALIWAGIALAAAMALLAGAVSIGRIFFVNAIAPTYVPTDAAQAIYDALVPLIYSTALAVGVAAVTLAVVAYFAGPFRGARAVRALTVDAADRLRAAAAAKGATTGRFGIAVYRARRYLRIAVAVIAAAVVLFVRPLTPGVILWTAIGALLAILLIEILQRPPSVTEATAGGAVGSEAVGSEAVVVNEPVGGAPGTRDPAAPGSGTGPGGV